MLWMVDFWMEGSSVSKWLDMEDHRLHTVVIAVGGGGCTQTNLCFIFVMEPAAASVLLGNKLVTMQNIDVAC
jgi:hypothetical protein